MKRRNVFGTGNSRMMALTAMILVLAASTLVQAASPADFYKGETITWVVSSGPGSSTDLLSRIAANALGQEIGAKVKIENMEEQGLNFIAAKAKPDGLTIGSKATTAILFNELSKAPGVQYKSVQYQYLTDLMPDVGALYVKAGSPLGTLDALRQAKDLKAGGTTAGGFLTASAAIIYEILGLNGKIVPGYKSPPAVFMALEQNEIDLVVFQMAAGLKRVQEGTAKAVFVISDEKFVPVPDLPTLEDLGVKIPANLADAYALIGNSGQAVIAPQGVAADKIKFLRDALDKVGKSPEIKKETEKIVGTWAPYVPGDKVQASITKIMSNASLGDQMMAVVKKYSAATK